MPGKLAHIWFAAVLACAGLAAHAAGMPDIGTKNFVPGSDAPAYLTNENLAVAPGSSGQSPIGTVFNQPAGPPPSTAAPARASPTRERRHTRFAAARKTTRHAAVSSASTRRSAHTTRRSAHLTGRAAVRARRASRGETARVARGARATVATARTAAKRGRASARHASARPFARKG
ncbi:MAG: hypothetical protein ACREE9_09960 [Stellaceae bacterium]